MHRTPRARESGSASVAAILVSVVLVGLSATLLSTVNTTSEQHKASHHRMVRQFVAEAGIHSAFIDIKNDGDGELGSESQPVQVGGGEFWTTVFDHGNQTFTVTSFARSQGREEVIKATVRQTNGIFANAVFAGNRFEDPNYTLEFGGNGTQGDLIVGDVYSGNDLELWGDASLDGKVRVSGSITGTYGEEGEEQPLPDLSSEDYENNHDFNVADDFDHAAAYYAADSAGGTAWQLPESFASHIFRKNPTDRLSDCNSTVKNDYFLEDPYEEVRSDSSRMDGSDAYRISVDDDVNLKVFYIDGNLWMHNLRTFSTRFKHDNPDGMRITFVVKGNVYFSDNIFYDDKDTDGLLIIAMEDEDVADSGNIYFGDPVFGTLEFMEAMMYAENNFYDNNLNAAGSAIVKVYGVMSAGNQVAINRDFGGQHSRLEVVLDRRVYDGFLEMPGLPDPQGDPIYELVAWRKSSEAEAARGSATQATNEYSRTAEVDE